MNIKIFKIKKGFKKGGVHTNPGIYWGVFLCIAFIIILVSLVFAFRLFEKINQELNSADESNAQTQTISKERIDSVLQYFSERKDKSDEIISSPSPVVDPSL